MKIKQFENWKQEFINTSSCLKMYKSKFSVRSIFPFFNVETAVVPLNTKKEDHERDKS